MKTQISQQKNFIKLNDLFSEINVKIKTLFIIIFVSVMGNFMNAQIDSTKQPTNNNHTYTEEYDEFDEEFFKKIRFRYGGGVLIPVGKSAEYFSTSPFIELNLDFQMKQRNLEIAFQAVIPNQNQNFTYHIDGVNLESKANVMINYMLRIKNHVQLNESTRLNYLVGIGASYIQNKTLNYDEIVDQKLQKYEYINTFLFAPGIEIRKSFNNRSEIIMGVNLQYSPYKTERNLKQDIGELFILPKITFRL